MLSVGQYGPSDRLQSNCYVGVLLALLTGHSNKVLDGCLEVDVVASISCLLARRMLFERRGERAQAMTPARFDEGILATDHNTVTGERGYHNTMVGPKVLLYSVLIVYILTLSPYTITKSRRDYYYLTCTWCAGFRTAV